MTHEDEVVKQPTFINIVSLEDEIFRIFSYENFLRSVINGTNYFRRVDLWDDPFENVLFKIPWMMNGMTVSVEDQMKSWYGQCWTKLPNETDAQWRVYSPQKGAVRVKTRIGKLLNSISNINDPFNFMKVFIGNVRYVDEKIIVDELTHPHASKHLIESTGSGPAYLLMLNRLAFQYEEEVRILYHALVDNTIEFWDQREGEIFNVNINDLFDEVVLDPRYTDDEYEQKRQELRSSGFTNPISHSSLYRLPSGVVINL